MDSKRGMEGVVPMGEVVDARSGVPESLEVAGGVGEVPASDGRAEEIRGAGQERMISAEMPPMVEGTVEGQGVQSEVQGDLVNLTTRDGESIEREWMKKTDKLMDKTDDNPHRRLDSFDGYRWNFMDKRYGRKMEGAA